MATDTKTGGRDATTAVIPGRFALSVGRPDLPSPEGWCWTALTSVAKLESGHTPSRKHPEYWGGDVPWIGIADATGKHGRVIFDTEQYTNQLGIANSSARVLPAGTVCLSRTASVGYVIMMGCPMATSQDFVNWVCSDRLNPHYLKYILLAERDALNMFSMGTTHQTIYFPEVKAFYVCLPNRKEQDDIVSVLRALDDKIELNRRLNSTLEAMVRAIFKDWFVDFGPIRAKLEGRARYLASEAWSLFPDRLDDEGKPDGWARGTLGDIATQVGVSVKPKNLASETPYIGLEHMPRR
jgi:type I restriction enzyme, S subunit